MTQLIKALKLISAHKLRAAVSTVGILFGTAFLILAFAIYAGYKDYLREQISVSGSNNIIIIPDMPLIHQYKSVKTDTFKVFQGLTVDDAESIKKILPDVRYVCSDVSYEVNINYELVNRQGELSGVSSDYFNIYNIKLSQGQLFLPVHYIYSKPVCIITSDLKKNLFADKNPLGKWIKCNDLYLRIIGVAEVKTDIDVPDELNMLNYSNTVYAPLQTVISRFYAYSASSFLHTGFSDMSRGSEIQHFRGSLKKITANFPNSIKVKNSSEIINRLLMRRHNNMRNFNIIIPEHIIARETWKARMSIIVVFSTSIICLIIGGIAIMNYIFASVYERYNYNQNLLSQGASISSIINPFLFQGICVSFAGGLIGIIAGIIFAKLFFITTKISTIVPLSSIFISFAISILAGFIFSFFPARVAAKK